MPDIYVNTDNSNVKAKIYKAAKMGKSADAAEKKMQAVIKDRVSKAPGFTVDKSGKGYTLKIEVTKAEQSGRDTIYTLRPAIVRFPLGSGQRGKGEFMVSTMTQDPTITAGSDEGLLLEGVELVTQNIVKVSLPLMKIDMAKR